MPDSKQPPCPVLCVIDTPGEPTFEVAIVCSGCGAELSSRTFDVTRDKAAVAGDLAIEDAGKWLEHPCSKMNAPSS
jgi:hypothetical protein